MGQWLTHHACLSNSGCSHSTQALSVYIKRVSNTTALPLSSVSWDEDPSAARGEQGSGGIDHMGGILGLLVFLGTEAGEVRASSQLDMLRPCSWPEAAPLGQLR